MYSRKIWIKYNLWRFVFFGGEIIFLFIKSIVSYFYLGLVLLERKKYIYRENLRFVALGFKDFYDVNFNFIIWLKREEIVKKKKIF